MRIGSTDASVIAINSRQDTSNSGGEGIKDGREAVQKRSPHVDTRNVSQITEVERRELPVSEKVVIDAIERANKVITGSNRKFEVSVHEKTKDIMVKVIDVETNTVVREIPPEKILDMIANLCELAGIFVDERR